MSLHLTFCLGLLACNEVCQYDLPEYKCLLPFQEQYRLYECSFVHSLRCSSVRWSGELRCRLLIHINIMEFPLELASWLDAIKIKSTNAAHTSAGSHLLYCRKQDNPFVWWKSFTTFPQFLLCSTEANKFSCSLLEKIESLIFVKEKSCSLPHKSYGSTPALLWILIQNSESDSKYEDIHTALCYMGEPATPKLILQESLNSEFFSVHHL